MQKYSFFNPSEIFRPILSTYSENYPRHTIIQGPEGFRVQLAVPGWCKENLSVSFDKGILTIEAKEKLNTLKEEEQFVYKGFSEKAFLKQFSISSGLELSDVFLDKGILEITLASTSLEKKSFEIREGG